MTDAFKGTVCVLDDDADLSRSLARLLRRSGYDAEPFVSPDDLLAAYHAPSHCVLSDVMLGSTDAFQFARRLREVDPSVGILFMTAWPRTADAVDAVRHHGGFDYLEKPIEEERLLAGIAEAVAWSKNRRAAEARLAALSSREREVLQLLAQGLSNKMVAVELGLSPRTVEDHRAAITAKTGAKGLAELIAIARCVQGHS
ncbi:response regulator transcription factor [Altericroceibacterium xinjiangense]|uniref:response regulator transcription factor n=1 Tax=Altericroceibacterium xinjiangense TaxID=762261 RepID=UPI000F7E944D|nr:LuxR C-terminal-related transcriptional regulator [Altericroceibacterium xinjiangense]